MDEREEREETNRRRRLQREKTRRREEKGEKARQRGRPESNEATRPRREEETVNEDEGGCSHCRGSVATECVYLCQAGHLHRDLPGEVGVFASRTSIISYQEHHSLTTIFFT